MTGLVGLVTLLAVFFYFYTGIAVAQARGKSGIKAPAMTGDPAFERAVRVQANTLEWLPIFLVSLWMFPTTWLGAWLPAAIGIVWIVGRFMCSGRGARGDSSPALRPVLERHVDLDGRIAATIEDFAGADIGDGGHGGVLEVSAS